MIYYSELGEMPFFLGRSRLAARVACELSVEDELVGLRILG